MMPEKLPRVVYRPYIAAIRCMLRPILVNRTAPGHSSRTQRQNTAPSLIRGSRRQDRAQLANPKLHGRYAPFTRTLAEVRRQRLAGQGGFLLFATAADTAQHHAGTTDRYRLHQFLIALQGNQNNPAATAGQRFQFIDTEYQQAAVIRQAGNLLGAGRAPASTVIKALPALTRLTRSATRAVKPKPASVASNKC